MNSIPIVIIKNKGVKVGDATEQTNPLTAHSASEDEYPRIHPILPLPKYEVPNNPISVDEYPQIYPILPATRDKVPNAAHPATSNPGLKNKPQSGGLLSIGKVKDATEKTNPLTADSTLDDEYPRIHPILPLPKEEVSNNPTSVDEYPQIHPILPLTRDKVENYVNPTTRVPPLNNKPPSVGLVSIDNEDKTPIIFKLQQGLSYNQASSKTQAYIQELVNQYENMTHDQETFTNQGVNLQSNYPIPIRMNPEQTLTQYQYSPADTNVGENQYVLYQQTDNPQYSYEYQNQYPQQVLQNTVYIQRVPTYNYNQQPNNNYGYNRPYYTQGQSGYRPPETIYSLDFSGLSGKRFGEIGSRIQSALHKLVRPFLR